MKVLATAIDPDGRAVDLTSERWAHIVGAGPDRVGHPELEAHAPDIIRAISDPSVRLAGRLPNEEWFYLEGVGPSRYLKVVVAFTSRRGLVITAFARRSMP